jgi:cell division protein FtsQ
MIRDYAGSTLSRPRAGRGRAALPLLAGICKVGALAVLTGGIALGAWEGYKRFVRLPYFSVREVRVEGNLQVAGEEIVAGLRLPAGTSLLEVDLGDLARRIERNPWIKEAWVRRQLPLSLIIQVVERVPEAVYVSDRRYLLSADGVILNVLTEDELPTLPVLRAARPVRLRPGERVLTTEVAHGLTVWRQFQVANALYGETAHEIAVAGDGSYVVSLGEQMPSIRLRATELPEQFHRLGAALAASGRALSNFSRVDLRFRDRVVFTLAQGR